jgi:hypothetical protein
LPGAFLPGTFLRVFPGAGRLTPFHPARPVSFFSGFHFPCSFCHLDSLGAIGYSYPSFCLSIRLRLWLWFRLPESRTGIPVGIFRNRLPLSVAYF